MIENQTELLRRTILAGLRQVESRVREGREVPREWLQHLGRLKAELTGEPSPACACELCRVVD